MKWKPQKKVHTIKVIKCVMRFVNLGLDMDVHTEQIVFPTVAVCPIEPFDMNRTVELAHSMLGYEKP